MGEAQVAAQGQGAHGRAVEEGGGAAGALERVLPLPLQGDDLVDEVALTPRFSAAESIAEGDDVCRRLLDDRVPAGLQQAQDGRLAGPGGTGEDV
jgi:hypothetical protein